MQKVPVLVFKSVFHWIKFACIQLYIYTVHRLLYIGHNLGVSMLYPALDIKEHYCGLNIYFRQYIYYVLKKVTIIMYCIYFTTPKQPPPSQKKHKITTK